MPSLAVIVLTYNEELHIARALMSLHGIASEVFVIDSGSTDRTVALAEQHGAKVLYNKFINQARQMQWALENIDFAGEWVMRLDADEYIEPDLAAEIKDRLPSLPDDVTGICFDRKHIFMGRWIRHGGRYPVRMLRLWRRGYACVENRWMDEHITVREGRTMVLAGGFADCNLHDLSYFIDKHNKYATREALDVLAKRWGLHDDDVSLLSHRNASWRVFVKRLLKENIYNRLAFSVSSTAYFLWRYIFLLGFLDGREGLVYHFLQGYWYRFLVGAKLMELERGVSGLSDKGDVIARLRDMTGHDLGAR